MTGLLNYRRRNCTHRTTSASRPCLLAAASRYRELLPNGISACLQPMLSRG